MLARKHRLYLLLGTACVVGYLWILFVSVSHHDHHYETPTLCLMKQATGLPCPSCGSTRSLLLLLNGDVTDALLLNPLGLVILFILILGPVWIARDWYLQSDSMVVCYRKTESVLRRKQVALPLVAAMLTNWIWNIFKGL